MSYDCEFGIIMPDDKIVHYRYPELDSPTYNLRNIFCEAMGFEYVQGEWYSLSDMAPRFEKAIEALRGNLGRFRELEPDNHWGTAEDALRCFENWRREAREMADYVPIEYLYWRW